MPAYGAVAEFLQARFGGPVREQDSVVTVGATLTVIAARDPERFQLTMVNLSGTEIFISPNQFVTTSRGILLSPNGGLVSVSVEEDGTLPSAEWSAISTLGGLSVYVLTVRRETKV